MRPRNVNRITLAATLLALSASLLGGGSVLAGDDPSIRGELRENIQRTMREHIDDLTIDGFYRHFDPMTDELLKLELHALHTGIVKKGDFYVSCADFKDQRGKNIDVDFLVLASGDDLKVIQAVVHGIDKEMRSFEIDQYAE